METGAMAFLIMIFMKEKRLFVMEKKKAPIKTDSGGGKIIKKPLHDRIAQTLFGGTMKESAQYAAHTYIIPGIRDLIFESITGALDRLIHGDGAVGYKGKSAPWNSGVSIYTPGTSYTSYSSTTKATTVMNGSSSREPQMILLNRKQDADELLRRMSDWIANYQCISVERYYDLANDFVPGTSKLITFTDAYYGWYNLQMARVRPYQGGYYIQFPPTEAVG